MIELPTLNIDAPDDHRPANADAREERAGRLARRSEPRDVVDVSGDASFPASDPPGWWAGA